MLKPLHDHVVLEVKTQETKTQSGIILSSNDQEKPSIASVVAVGEGKLEDGKRLPMTVKIGDQVVYKRYATTEFKHDDKEYLIIKESDILAIVEGE
ncbi:MAG: co-chaperone GroES [Candidatus Izemoplasmataceae bacterium]